ncbi:MAG: glycoside hydrolase family 3 C-terminal domain-containing protein [Acidocella sp.]|nr:glycoside hydrolase family 3 C-terminal domain-containing protein [Acidocella sp.]
MRLTTGAAALTLALTAASARADAPWMNPSLSPDARADALEAKLDETQKLSLLHGHFALAAYYGAFSGSAPPPIPGAIGSSGFVPGIAALAVPALQETDGGLGVSDAMDEAWNTGATPLPANLALAASFDPALAHATGSIAGQEAWRRGFNVLLAGGVNLTRDPRGGRNFEYLGEDPYLAGQLDGQIIAGIQAQHVVATIKHFALNDKESNRYADDAHLNEASARESDLLAFELAIEGGAPASVMCSYNLVGGAYACGNAHLLNDVLKHDWHYPGWVMSDWGAVHSVKDALAGLDQESGEEFDAQVFFDTPLADAVKSGAVPQARIDGMVHRILRSMFAVGLFDHPPVKTPIDYQADALSAQHEEEEGLVLLKNNDNLLPLTKGTERVAVIGGYANAGVLSGGGSSQVIPDVPAQLLPTVLMGEGLADNHSSAVIDPDAPLAAMHDLAPAAQFRFDPGNYPSSAARLAKWADVVVVFARKWQTESQDVPDLTLPDGQDAMIEDVAKANPHTIVVLETGNPVQMPWLDDVAGVVEAWYPGGNGGHAIANALFGAVDPSGHLPMTFPHDAAQLPRPDLSGLDAAPGQITSTDYDIEGADVGYRWYAARGLTPLFPFGYGLSYTSFGFSHLALSNQHGLIASFDVTNTGKLPGAAVPQLYLTARASQRTERLIGFARISLAPGETQHVSLTIDPRLLADFDTNANDWRVDAGVYDVALARSAADIAETAAISLPAARVAP